MRHLLFSLALALSNADMSLQNVLATRTTSSSASSHYATPIPTSTEAPCANDSSELRRRAGLYSTPRNICGWFSGTSAVAWKYNDAFATCFFNSDVNIVGNRAPFQTTCVDGAQLSAGPCTTCSGSVLECSSTASFCETYFYGSDYFAYGCGTKSGISHILQTTPDGMTGPIAFPIYTGERGISTGIQYPSDYPSESRTIETSSYSLPSSTESTAPPISTPTNSLLDPSSTPSKEASSKSAPVGAIVGGVIGGVFLIALIVGIVLFFVIYSRRKNQNPAPPQHQPPQNGFGNPQVKQYPPMQQHYPLPNNPQGGFVPQANANQHGFPPQQPANPEFDPNLVNQQGFNQGAVSHIQPNQHTPPPQQPTNPELDSRLINPQGFNLGAVSHIQSNGHTPSPSQPTAPEFNGSQPNYSQGVFPSELSQNQSAIPQQQPSAPELHGNQPNLSQGVSPSELYNNQVTIPQQQPAQPELDSRPANQAYLQQVFVSDGQPPQMRDGSRIHEAP